MSIELKDPDSNLNSLVDPEQEELLLRMKLNKDLMAPPETIVEVVNPLVLGDGSVNYIDTSSVTTEDMMRPKFQVTDNRLSLNDKMKNVLVELLENEKVKLNRSLSMTDSDMEGGVAEDDDEEEEDGEGAFEVMHGYDQTNNNQRVMNTVFIVREKLINDYYDYESESHTNSCQVFENPHASFDDVRMEVDNALKADSEENLLLKQKIIDELNVCAAPDRSIEVKTTTATVDESHSEQSSAPTTPSTTNPSTPSHIPVATGNKNKKKRKNRKK